VPWWGIKPKTKKHGGTFWPWGRNISAGFMEGDFYFASNIDVLNSARSESWRVMGLASKMQYIGLMNHAWIQRFDCGWCNLC